jgi:hypothetical protein
VLKPKPTAKHVPLGVFGLIRAFNTHARASADCRGQRPSSAAARAAGAGAYDHAHGAHWGGCVGAHKQRSANRQTHTWGGRCGRGRLGAAGCLRRRACGPTSSSSQKRQHTHTMCLGLSMAAAFAPGQNPSGPASGLAEPAGKRRRGAVKIKARGNAVPPITPPLLRLKTPPPFSWPQTHKVYVPPPPARGDLCLRVAAWTRQTAARAFLQRRAPLPKPCSIHSLPLGCGSSRVVGERPGAPAESRVVGGLSSMLATRGHGLARALWRGRARCNAIVCRNEMRRA